MYFNTHIANLRTTPITMVIDEPSALQPRPLSTYIALSSPTDTPAIWGPVQIPLIIGI